MSFERNREALLRRRRELYRQHRERETPEEREVRLARRREYYRRRRTARSTEQEPISQLIKRSDILPF